MAYFANGTEGAAFDDQCSRCKYGLDYCPIAFAQSMWNYDACNNKTARKILDSLVKDNGTCTMFKTFQKDFEIK